MNTDTPETDNLARGNYVAHPTVWSILRKLERERDEAREQRDRLAEALQNIKNELGVPQPEYPAPIANAVKISDEALQSLTTTEP